MGLFDLFKKKERTYICARCNKEIPESEAEWIGNHRFCLKCASPTTSKTDKKADDGKRYSVRDTADATITNVNDNTEDAINTTTSTNCKEIAIQNENCCAGISTKEEAIRVLRNKIIEEITKNKADTYQLTFLSWDAAAKCFPKSGFQWDGAWFKIDLSTMKLFVEVQTYPNQFGACYEDTFSITAIEFHRIANEFGFPEELKLIQTDEDWEKLFDENLNATISDVKSFLKKQEEEQTRKAQIKNAVVIPDKFKDIQPSMEFTKIVLDLHQRYGDTGITIIQEAGEYQLTYTHISHLSSNVKKNKRVLSPIEATWMEQQVDAVLKNRDKTTWQSLPGGDMITVEIKKQQKMVVSIQRGLPLNKYKDLQNLLEKLTEYGSIFESEAKQSS